MQCSTWETRSDGVILLRRFLKIIRLILQRESIFVERKGNGRVSIAISLLNKVCKEFPYACAKKPNCFYCDWGEKEWSFCGRPHPTCHVIGLKQLVDDVNNLVTWLGVVASSDSSCPVWFCLQILASSSEKTSEKLSIVMSWSCANHNSLFTQLCVHWMRPIIPYQNDSLFLISSQVDWSAVRTHAEFHIKEIDWFILRVTVNNRTFRDRRILPHL